MNPLVIFCLKDAALAGTAAMAFGLCLGVPCRMILACGLCAGMGHSTQALLGELGAPWAAATLAGSFLVGMLGLLFSHRLFVPRLIFTVPGIIPMLPGTYVFNAILALMQTAALGVHTPPTIAIDAFSSLLHAAIILCALVAGIALPNLFLYYHAPDF